MLAWEGGHDFIVRSVVDIYTGIVPLSQPDMGWCPPPHRWQTDQYPPVCCVTLSCWPRLQDRPSWPAARGRWGLDLLTGDSGWQSEGGDTLGHWAVSSLPWQQDLYLSTVSPQVRAERDQREVTSFPSPRLGSSSHVAFILHSWSLMTRINFFLFRIKIA